SLNLAQAALLVLYQLFQSAGGEAQTYRPPRHASPRAPSSLVEDLFADLERMLDAIQFLKSRSRTNTLRSLRVALYRARLNVREASLLRATMIEVRRFLRRTGVLAEVGPIGAGKPARLTHASESGMLTSGSIEADCAGSFATEGEADEGQVPEVSLRNLPRHPAPVARCRRDLENQPTCGC